jgi:hypothetical protein
MVKPNLRSAGGPEACWRIGFRHAPWVRTMSSATSVVASVIVMKYAVWME